MSKIKKKKQVVPVIDEIKAYSIDNDTLDFLEIEADKYNETVNLSDKLKNYKNIKEIIVNLEKEINNITENIDNLDIMENVKEIESNEITDKTDINDDIIIIEDLVKKMTEEHVLQQKFLYIKKITESINYCKTKCKTSKMNTTYISNN